MVVADLHVHTTNSDGTLTLDALPGAARSAGLSAVAVTDHDRLHPDLDAPVKRRDGIPIVHGIELRVAADCGKVDLLGYGVSRTDALVDEIERLQANRRERAREIVECLEDRLDVTLDVPYEPGVGRPHIARAVEASPAPYDVQSAFEDLIGQGRPCFVAREIPSFEHGRELLSAACGVVGLAHPFRYDNPERALDLAADLDAVERYYPYGEPVDASPVDRVIEEHDLLALGGSDAHGEELGQAGLSAPEWERVHQRLGPGEG